MDVIAVYIDVTQGVEQTVMRKKEMRRKELNSKE